MKYLKIFLISLILTSTFSCALFKKYMPAPAATGESAIAVDATPPANYNPNYINKVAEFTKSKDIKYQTRVIYSEVDSGKVKMYFNITDDNGTVYINADDPKFKKMWCLTEEEIDSVKYPVKDYKLTNYTETDDIPYAIGLVLDHSGSMGTSRAFTVQNAVASFINDIKRPNDAIGIVKYDNQTNIEVPLTTDNAQILSTFRVEGLQNYGGWTAINDGIIKAVEMLDQTTSKYKAVVVFTDGYENKSTNSKEQAIKAVKDRGIQLFAIDFGENIDTTYMKSIAEGTGGCYYHMYQTQEFGQIYTDIYKRLKNVYLLEYTPAMFGNVNFKLELCNETEKVALTHDFQYLPEKGNFTLVNIYFDTGKDVIKKEFKSEIDRLTKIMKNYPELIIEIGGHTDDVGTDESNQTLSQKRANAVMEAIVKNGIDPKRISAKGYGETVLVADNKTQDGRSKNRRTEFVIVK